MDINIMENNIKYTSINSIGAMASNFTRMINGPLDCTSTFKSIEDFKYYLGIETDKSKTTSEFQQTLADDNFAELKPYVGQICTVFDQDKIKLFIITNGTVDETEDSDTEGMFINGEYQEISPLNGKEFDFNNTNLKTVLTDLIVALGGVVKSDTEEDSGSENEESSQETEQ